MEIRRWQSHGNDKRARASISVYATKAGPRFLIKFTAQRGNETLRAEIRRTELGERVESSPLRLLEMTFAYIAKSWSRREPGDTQ